MQASIGGKRASLSLAKAHYLKSVHLAATRAGGRLGSSTSLGVLAETNEPLTMSQLLDRSRSASRLPAGNRSDSNSRLSRTSSGLTAHSPLRLKTLRASGSALGKDSLHASPYLLHNPLASLFAEPVATKSPLPDLPLPGGLIGLGLRPNSSPFPARSSASHFRPSTTSIVTARLLESAATSEDIKTPGLHFIV